MFELANMMRIIQVVKMLRRIIERNDLKDDEKASAVMYGLSEIGLLVFHAFHQEEAMKFLEIIKKTRNVDLSLGVEIVKRMEGEMKKFMIKCKKCGSVFEFQARNRDEIPFVFPYTCPNCNETNIYYRADVEEV